MGAALGAAGEMDGERAIAQWRNGRRDARRDGARSDMGRRANRRAGTGDDAPARIVGADDEAELRGGGDKGGRGPGGEPDRHQRAVRRGAQAACARRFGGIGHALQRSRIGMTEGEAEAAG